jgi:tetratricopeptide (TPR) repeat protein
MGCRVVGVVLLGGVVALAAPASAGDHAADEAATTRYLRGQVVMVGAKGERIPAKGVKLWIRGRGDPALSRDGGEFRLLIPKVFRPGDRLTIEAEKKGYRIQHPLEGEIHLPADFEKDAIEVRLLPVGSRLFLTDAAIENLIGQMRVRARDQITATSNPGEVDPARYVPEWAAKYGLSPTEVRSEVARWASEVEANRGSDLLKRSSGAFARREFEEAAHLSHNAGEESLGELVKLEKQDQALAAKKRALRESAATAFKTEGDSAYTGLRFEQALTAYRRILDLVRREGEPMRWAAAWADIGKTEDQIGIRVEGPTLQDHLSRSVEAYKLALQVRTRDQVPQDWANTQNNLGAVLRDQGERTAGQKGNELLGQALEAYELALQVRTRDQFPQDWAMTQNNLGNVLSDLGERTAGQKGNDLLGQSVEAYKLALQVRTRDQLPQDWAMTQNNLGVVLSDLGERTAGQKGNDLLGQAVEACKLALQV